MAGPGEKAPRYFIDEETVIENTTTDAVFQKTLDWLKRKNAKVNVQNPPYVIKASHGSWLWAGDPTVKAKKNLEFVFTQRGNDVTMRTMVSGLVTSFSVEEIKRQWLSLVEELWAELGVRDRPGSVKQLFQPSRLVEEVKAGYRIVYLGLSGGLLLFSGFIVALSFFPDLENYSGFFSVPFMYAIFGYWSTRKARKRLLEQGVEGSTVPKLTGDRRFVLVLVVSIIGTVAVTGYIMAFPIHQLLRLRDQLPVSSPDDYNRIQDWKLYNFRILWGVDSEG